MAHVELRDIVTGADRVDTENTPFYERYGFTQTGEIDEGEVVLRLALMRPAHEEDR